MLPWIGVVEDFDFSIDRLQRRLHAEGFRFVPQTLRANATAESGSTLAERLDSIRRELGGALYQRLCSANLADWALWERAWRLLRSDRPADDHAAFAS